MVAILRSPAVEDLRIEMSNILSIYLEFSFESRFSSRVYEATKSPEDSSMLECSAKATTVDAFVFVTSLDELTLQEMLM